MGTNPVNNNTFDPFQQLKRQDGRQTDEQIKSITSLKNQYLSAKTDEVRVRIIETLCREVNDDTLVIFSNKEKSDEVRKAAWNALKEIIASYTEGITKDNKNIVKTTEHLKMLKITVSLLEDALDEDSTEDERTAYRAIIQDITTIALTICKEQNRWADAAELIDQACEIDPDLTAYTNTRPSGEERITYLKGRYIAMYGHMESKKNSKALDDCIAYKKFLKTFPDTLLTNSGLPKIKEIEDTIKLLRQDKSSGQIIADTFKRIAFQNAKNQESPTYAAYENMGNQNLYREYGGQVSKSISDNGESALSVTGFFSTPINDLHSLSGDIMIAQSEKDTRDIKATTKLTQNYGQLQISEDLSGNWHTSDTEKDYNYFTLGISENYRVRSDNYLLNNMNIGSGIKVAVWGDLPTINHGSDQRAMWDLGGEHPYYFDHLPSFFKDHADAVPGSTYHSYKWTRSPKVFENNAVLNKLALNMGVQNGYYLLYTDEDNYWTLDLSASASSRYGLNAGIGTRIAYTPDELISFDIEGKSTLNYINAGAEIELGGDSMHLLAGASMLQGIYAGIGRRNSIWGVSDIFQAVFGWTGGETELKLGTCGFSLVVTPNLPGDRGGSLTFTWITGFPMVMMDQTFNPGKINEYADGSSGTYETTRYAQEYGVDGSTTSYVQHGDDPNSYTIKIQPGPEDESLGETFARVAGNLALSATVVGPIIWGIVRNNMENKGTRTVSIDTTANKKRYIVTDTFENGKVVKYLLEEQGKEEYDIVDVLISMDNGQTWDKGKRGTDDQLTVAGRNILYAQIAPLRDTQKLEEYEKVLKDPNARPSTIATTLLEKAHAYARLSKRKAYRETLETAYTLLKEQFTKLQDMDPAEAYILIKTYGQVCIELGEHILRDQDLFEEKKHGHELIAEGRTFLFDQVSKAKGKYKDLLTVEYVQQELKFARIQKLTMARSEKDEKELEAQLDKAIAALTDTTVDPPLTPTEKEVLAQAYALRVKHSMEKLEKKGSTDPMGDFRSIVQEAFLSLTIGDAGAVSIQNMSRKMLAEVYTLLKLYPALEQDLQEMIYLIESNALNALSSCSSPAAMKAKAEEEIGTSTAELNLFFANKLKTTVEVLKMHEKARSLNEQEARQLKSYTKLMNHLYKAAYVHYDKLYKNNNDLSAGMKALDIRIKRYGLNGQGTLEQINELHKKILPNPDKPEEKLKHVKADQYLSILDEYLAGTDQKNRSRHINNAIKNIDDHIEKQVKKGEQEYEMLMHKAELLLSIGKKEEAMEILEDLAESRTAASYSARAMMADIYQYGLIPREQILKNIKTMTPEKIDLLFDVKGNDQLIANIDPSKIAKLLYTHTITKAEAEALLSMLKEPQSYGGTAPDPTEAEDVLTTMYNNMKSAKTNARNKEQISFAMISILTRRAEVRRTAHYYFESIRTDVRADEINEDIGEATVLIDELISFYKTKGDAEAHQMIDTLQKQKIQLEHDFKIADMNEEIAQNKNLEKHADSENKTVAFNANLQLAEQKKGKATSLPKGSITQDKTLREAEEHYQDALDILNGMPDHVVDLSRKEQIIDTLCAQAKVIEDELDYMLERSPNKRALDRYTEAQTRILELIENYKEQINRTNEDKRDSTLYEKKKAALEAKQKKIEAKINELKKKIEQE